MKDYKFPTIEELLEAGVHFGHSINKWNPKMEPYIYTAKQGMHVLDLDKTHKMLKEAGELIFDIASKGGQIIFVCTKKQVAEIAKQEALRCGAMFVNERWMGGTITNYKIIKKSIDKLVNLKKKRESGELAMYTKKERLLIDRDIQRLERFFGGVVDLKSEPQAVFVVDVKREKTAVHECNIYKVPVIALIDTNSDPAGVTKLVPGNDDAAKSVGKVLKVIADCVEEGYKEFERLKKEGAKKEDEKAKEEVEKEVEVKEEEPKETKQEKVEVKEESKVVKEKPAEPVKKPAKKVVKKAATKTKSKTKKEKEAK